MKKILTFAMGALALTAVTATAAGKYPFPQNMKHPYGTTIEYASTDEVKAHYDAWKKAWYQASNGWVLAPEGTCSTVSEAIAYGMLITVYMDDESTFKKLYSVWNENGGNGGAGMNWRIGCGSENGNGSATDADEDAAVALVMASVQWSNSSYLSDAKSLMSWMIQHDFDGDKMKPGSNWTSFLNPSYVMLGHYRLFEKVSADSKWSSIRQQAAKDLLACQDKTTGLVADWCDLNGYKPAQSGQVSNDLGYYDDASRTPWRTAWAYYWYGDSDAKKFNETITKWLIPATHTASGVNSGYKYKNGSYEADLSAERNFVSSSFSGGLGLATSSVDSDAAKTYLGTTYKALTTLKSCATAEGCGETVTGEKYYPATLNVLYLLLMTGNMPNLYEIDNFTKFTPDPNKAPSINKIGGKQMELKDTTVGVSGFWNWGGYHDKFGLGTKMVPDSGTSPLFQKADGSIYAEASMEIGAEPDYDKDLDEQGKLLYPSAGIAMSFLKDDKKGVDFTKLGIKAVRVTMKASGPIRMAVLNEKTYDNDKKFNAGDKSYKNAKSGSEPGIYVPNSDDYVATTYSLEPCLGGFVGMANKCDGKGIDEKQLNILTWVDEALAPDGATMLTCVAGLKWEVKDAKGGIGELSIKSVEFLDASGNVVDPVTITGVKVPDQPVGIKAIAASSAAKLSVAGMNIAVEGVKAGSDIAVFSLQGKLVASTKAVFGNATVTVPTKGIYLVRAGGKVTKVNVK